MNNLIEVSKKNKKEGNYEDRELNAGSFIHVAIQTTNEETLKNVKRKNKSGFSMLKYGMHQAKGFTTKNHFAVKKGDKVLGYRDYSSGIRVLPRPFVYPIEGQIKKSQTNNDVFIGLVEVDKESQKEAVKVIRKYLKGKVVKKFK